MFYVDVGSVFDVFSPAEWRSMLSRCFDLSLCTRCSPLEYRHYFYEFHGLISIDGRAAFFSASSSELRPCQFMTVVMWTYTHSLLLQNNNNTTPPRLAGLTYWWGSVASQFLTHVGELAGVARCQPGSLQGQRDESNDG